MTAPATAPRTRLRWLRRLRGWNAVVAASALIVAVLALALVIGWLASSGTRIATYTVASPISRIELHVASGAADVIGGASRVQVSRTDDAAFGRWPTERRSLQDGVLSVHSSCPPIVVGHCSSSYRVSVPDNVNVLVIADGGDVHVSGVRADASIVTGSGNVSVDAFCGFMLNAGSGSGSIHVATACAAKAISLHSASGSIAALVPPGRYRIQASSGSGASHVSGLDNSAGAPFTIDLHSGSGDVSLGSGV